MKNIIYKIKYYLIIFLMVKREKNTLNISYKI